MNLTEMEKIALSDMCANSEYFWMRSTCESLEEKGLVIRSKMNGFILTSSGKEEQDKLISGEKK